MQFTQTVSMAFKAISGNKVRAFLTMLGVIIGVMSVIVLIAIGQGTTASVTESISSMGTNLLTVSIQTRRVGGFGQLVNADETLFHGQSPALHQFQAGHAGDAPQDGAGQHGRDHLAAQLEHDVHAAAFLHVLVVDSVHPQHLREALGRGALSGPVGRAVVAAALGLARAATDGAP